MTFQLVIEPEAEAELEHAAQRYEESVAGLGREFLAEMRRRTEAVRHAPHAFAAFGGVDGVRCAHAVDRFPHLIVFMTVADTVHVLAYMHPRQRPGYWTARVPG